MNLWVNGLNHPYRELYNLIHPVYHLSDANAASSLCLESTQGRKSLVDKAPGPRNTQTSVPRDQQRLWLVNHCLYILFFNTNRLRHYFLSLNIVLFSSTPSISLHSLLPLLSSHQVSSSPFNPQKHSGSVKDPATLNSGSTYSSMCGFPNGLMSW